MSDDEVFKAWVNDCLEKLKRLDAVCAQIRGLSSATASAPPAPDIIAEKLLTPYIYFKREWLERGEDKVFHGERESGVAQTGERAGADRALARDSQQSGPVTAAAESTKSAPQPVTSPKIGAIGGDVRTNEERMGTLKCASCGKDFVPKIKSAKLCLDCWRKEHRRL